MTNDIPLSFPLPTVRRKKLTIDFDGGTVSSDGGLSLLPAAERRRRGPQRGGSLRYTDSSAPRPVAAPSPMGSNVL